MRGPIKSDTREMQLLCAVCAPPHPDSETRWNAHLAAGLDWKTFVQLALDHGVLPLACARLLASTVVHLPGELRSAMQSRLEAHRKRVEVFIEAQSAVLSRLTELGVEAIAFKGPTLSQRAFGDPALRVYSDLDILVADGDVDRTVQCLLGMGYRHQAYLSPRQLAGVRRYGGQYFMYDPITGVAVEPHWSFAPTTLAIDIDYQKLRQRTVKVTLPAGQIRTLAPEHEALMLCIHASKEYWRSLKPVVDLAAFLHRHPRLDWPLLLAEARRWGCQRMVLLGVRLCRNLLTWPMPAACEPLVASDSAVTTLARSTEKHINQGRPPALDPYRIDRFRLLLRERPTDKIRFVSRTLLTPRAQHYGLVDLPRRVRWLYIPVKVGWDYLLLPLHRLMKRHNRVTS